MSCVDISIVRRAMFRPDVDDSSSEIERREYSRPEIVVRADNDEFRFPAICQIDDVGYQHCVYKFLL